MPAGTTGRFPGGSAASADHVPPTAHGQASATGHAPCASQGQPTPPDPPTQRTPDLSPASSATATPAPPTAQDQRHTRSKHAGRESRGNQVRVGLDRGSTATSCVRYQLDRSHQPRRQLSGSPIPRPAIIPPLRRRRRASTSLAFGRVSTCLARATGRARRQPHPRSSRRYRAATASATSPARDEARV